MTMNWASALDLLVGDPDHLAARAWVEERVHTRDGTPGQLRAAGLVTGAVPMLELLRRTPRAIRDKVESRQEEELLARPSDGGWNATEVVHHVADNEAVNHVRLRSILTEDEPEIFGYDSEPWTRFYAVESMDAALARFEVGRRNTLAVAATLSAEDWGRRGHLSYRGPESVRVLLLVLAGHDHDHLGQLDEIISG